MSSPDPRSYAAPERLVVLDTAHLAGLISDAISNSRERRRSAQRFIADLLERRWLPLLSWHHLEELLQHRDEALVDARVRYLRELPRAAWVRPFDDQAGPGSILEVFRAEVAAAAALPGARTAQVRDLARQHVIVTGAGADAIPENFRDWRLLRPALAGQQANARRVAAISRWRAHDIDDKPIGTWFGQPARAPEDVALRLGRMREALAAEISARGDKRIPDPRAMATEFVQQVADDGFAVTGGSRHAPAVQLLVNAGLDPEDIDPSTTFRQTMDLLMFHRRLRLVAESFELPWAELKRRALRGNLPSVRLEDAMRLYAQDQPERKGSELNDTHLLCLSPYADLTFVDKRTLESLRRARTKCPDLDQLLGKVVRASTYSSLASMLAEL